MTDEDLKKRIERMERQIAWAVRQIRKILRFLELGEKDDDN